MSQLVRDLVARAGSLPGLRHPLPDFLIIGVRKGGTSSLHNYLRQHPDVLGPARKEPRFFHHHWRRGSLWYRRFFPDTATVRRQAERHGRRPLVFEATPDNLYWPEVPGRVARTLPEGRFVAILRNPVDRAWSDYNAHRRAGRESRPFDEVIGSELEVLGGPLWDPDRFDGRVGPKVRLVSRGLYADQLDRWYREVSASSTLVLCSEDLFRDASTEVDRVTDFLGLRRHDGYRFTTRNAGTYHESMSAEVRALLRDYFGPHNRRLYGIVGRDLGWD